MKAAIVGLPAIGDARRVIDVARVVAQVLAPHWDREFADSPLEGDGFEPSVPLGTTGIGLKKGPQFCAQG
jgi:hypothetical protein